MADLLERITFNPNQCGGTACIRGIRIRVTDIADLFEAGLTAEEIIDEMPDLQEEYLCAALLFVANTDDDPQWPIAA